MFGLKTNNHRIQVVAGILQDADGRYLITDRLNAGSMRDFWEFPGGKIMPVETPAAALRRELDEELGIRISAFDHFFCLTHDYPDIRVAIDFFIVSEWRGIPRGAEGQRLRWVDSDALAKSRLLPADKPLIEALRQRK